MAPSKPLRVVGYARVSSSDQARGSSLRDQQETMRRYAESLGLEVATYYVEAESAVREKIEHRERMQALLADLRAGDLVLCDKIDRWSRDPEFTYSSVRRILEAGARFYAVGDRLDPSTREGDSQLGFRIIFAREEHKRIRERMVGTREILRDQGHYVEGLPPFGYRRQASKGHKSPTKNILVPHPEEAALVQTMFAQCIAGRSLHAIAEAVGQPRSRVSDALSRRLYLGEMQDSQGRWIRARHEPIVDPETFERARAALDARRHGGARPRSAPSETSGWLLRDIAVCADCGARMAAAYGGKPPKRRYYYRCSRASCQARMVRVEALELLAEGLFVERLGALRDELTRPLPKAPKAKTVDLSLKRQELEKRRLRYVDVFAEGLMDKDTLRHKLGDIDTALLRLEASAAEQAKASPLVDQAKRAALLATVAGIETAWAHTSKVERRELARLLASSARLANDAPPVLVWRTAEELAARGGEHVVR